MKEKIIPFVGILALSQVACGHPGEPIVREATALPDNPNTITAPDPALTDPDDDSPPIGVRPYTLPHLSPSPFPFRQPYTDALSEEQLVRNFVEAMARDDLQQAVSFIAPDTINELRATRHMDFLSRAMKGCVIDQVYKFRSFYIKFKNRCGSGTDSVDLDIKTIENKPFIDPFTVSPMHADRIPPHLQTPTHP